MRICAVELKGDDAIFCIMSKNMGLLDIPEVRQRKITISNTQDTENMRWFQRQLLQLVTDYKVEKVVIRERPMKGKFAGGAVGFKLEAAIQLIEDLNVELQEQAFITAYACLHMQDGLYGANV